MAVLSAKEAASHFLGGKDSALEKFGLEQTKLRIAVAFIPSEGWYCFSIYESGMLSGYEFLVDGHTGDELCGWQTE